MIRRRLREDSGQAAPLVAVSLLGLLAVIALVIDGGLLFAGRRNLQSIADAAARAGAMEIDEQALREGNGRTVELQPELAEMAMAEYLKTEGFDGSVTALADITHAVVRLRTEHRTVLLSLVGISDFTITASSTAGPRSGSS
jgi:Flp pilus assembly protein TadG